MATIASPTSSNPCPNPANRVKRATIRENSLFLSLTHLRDIGNTVLVVEHDADTMRAADWLIDLGPGPGVLGGKVISEGSMVEGSYTGRFLREGVELI